MQTRCTRCRSLMVKDFFMDMLDDTGQLSFNGWRCVCCWNVLDPVIVRNRRAHRFGPSCA
jgi:hypothetical protein